MSLGMGDGPVRPSRTARAEASVRRKRLYSIGAVVIVAAIGIGWMRFGDRGASAGPTPSATDTVPAGQGPSGLLAFSVTGAPNALLAMIGAGGGQPPAGLILPPRMSVIVPGQGETPTEQVQALPGDSMRIGVSNAVGAWAPHYAVMSLNGFGNAIDRVGGLTVDLPDVYTVGGSALGPGRTHMSGDQVVTFLYEKADDTELRWEAVLQAFLKAAPAVSADDLTETDGAAGAAAVLAAASDADVQVAPTRTVGTAVVPAQPDLDDLVGRLFGTPKPVRVFVQNGTGTPGIGEAVARDLLPEGFRIVLSGNAESFNHDTTTITATGADHADDANRAQRALGVGTVQVSQVPSGLADVTIVVGRDFKG